jgi:hypothetical protein
MDPVENMPLYDLLASFDDERGLDRAAAELRRAHCFFETFSPMPRRETEKGSATPRVTFAAGLLGVTGGFAMQAYANMIGYPLDIGGRPTFSWPSFIPIAFEMGVGLAVIVSIVAAFVSAGLLRLQDPLDEANLMRRAMSDRWLLALKASDAEGRRRAREICQAAGATAIEEAGPWSGGS